MQEHPVALRRVSANALPSEFSLEQCRTRQRTRFHILHGSGEKFDNPTFPHTLSAHLAGVVAQLVEHHNGIVGVRGSNPLGSTSFHHFRSPLGPNPATARSPALGSPTSSMHGISSFPKWWSKCANGRALLSDRRYAKASRNTKPSRGLMARPQRSWITPGGNAARKAFSTASTSMTSCVIAPATGVK